jgi:hypothetical protein
VDAKLLKKGAEWKVSEIEMKPVKE